MVSIMSLWAPIVLSAVAVFIVSSIIHMFLGYHKSDHKQLPNEDEILDVMSKANIPPGDYCLPYAGDMETMKSESYIDKCKRGPMGFLTIDKSGTPSMTGSLIGWFIYSIIVSIIAAYIAGHAVAPGDSYLSVFRFAGCTAFVGYSLALMQNSIWYKRQWSSTLKSMFDGLIYGCLTAGVFGWLWPGM